MSDRGVLRFIPSRVDGISRRHRGCDLYRTIENIFIRSVHNIPICGYRHMASPRAVLADARPPWVVAALATSCRS